MHATRKPGFHQRKIVYIKKEFQLRFILRFCALVLVGSVVSTLLMYLNSRDTLTTVYAHSRLSILTTSEVILPAVIYSNLITLALIAAAVAVTTLYISHKIAGPLYRIEQDLTAVAQGNLGKRIHLRGKDQMGDLASSLNAMLDSLQGNVTAIGQQVEQAILDIETMRDDNGSCPVEETRERLERIRKDIADRFQL